MPDILVPSRRLWTAQPQRLVAIDAPPGASVRFALLGSQGMRNLVGVQPTISGTPIVSHLRGLPVVRLDTSNRFSAGPKVIDRGRFTVVFVGGLDAPSTSYGCLVFGQVQSNTATASAATYDWAIYESVAANQVSMQASNGSAVVNASPPDAPAWIAGKQRSVAACFDAGVPKISVDGGAVGVGAALSGGLVAANWGMQSGGYWGNSTYNPVVRIALAVVLDGWAASPAELQALSANPWQIFRARRRAIYVDMGAGGGSLPASASGGAQAGGSAAPSVQVALAGVGVALAGGTAGITAAVPLSAAGFSVVSAAANPSATVTLSAAGLAQAAAAAGISASVLLQASGAAQASGNATLAAHLSMLASGAAQAAGSATATLTGAGQIAAAGSAHADGAAALVVSVSLTAAGTSSASGAATLTGGSAGAVSASGAAQATGIGTVQVAVSLTASGFVQAMGAGAFAVQIPLAAIGSATATGSATLHDLAAVALVKDKRFAVGRRRNFAVTRRRVFAVSGRSYAH